MKLEKGKYVSRDDHQGNEAGKQKKYVAIRQGEKRNIPLGFGPDFVSTTDIPCTLRCNQNNL